MPGEEKQRAPFGSRPKTPERAGSWVPWHALRQRCVRFDAQTVDGRIGLDSPCSTGLPARSGGSERGQFRRPRFGKVHRLLAAVTFGTRRPMSRFRVLPQGPAGAQLPTTSPRRSVHRCCRTHRAFVSSRRYRLGWGSGFRPVTGASPRTHRSARCSRRRRRLPRGSDQRAARRCRSAPD